MQDIQMIALQSKKPKEQYKRGDNMGNGLFDYIRESSSNPKQGQEKQKTIETEIASTEELRQSALKIIENYRINQEIVTGCKAQILKDIENKENPYRMLYAAVEAISRLTGDGDNFFLQVEKKIADVYGLKGVKHD